MTDNLPVSEADFSTIKSNLQTYLQNQSQFRDYNFTGSAINILLDILAYNTHYAASHANLVFAETFMDSAQLRGSVVSRAKEVGYIPRSPTTSVAVITMNFAVSGNPAQYIIPQGTIFTSSVQNTTYNFVTKEDILVENVNNSFSVTFNIHEGVINTFTYVVDLTDASQRFIIPSTNTDTNFLTVLWKANTGVDDSLYTPWAYSRNVELGDLTPNTPVYFLKEAFDGYFEVYFGDGVIGQALTQGNVVQLQYLITSADASIGAQTFALASALPSVSGVTIQTVSSAQGGAPVESTESVQYLAPFYYASQGRAVTEADYTSLIKTTYSSVKDVTVWGGEKNNPPYYGTVFIAVVPHNETTFSAGEKQAIQNDIVSRYNIVSIRPVIVDPDYTNVGVDVTVVYNSKLYNTAGGVSLTNVVTNAINNFFNSTVNKFGANLYYSQLVDAIDASSNLIVDCVVNLTMTKTVEIFPSIAGTYIYNFNNALYPGSLASSTMIIDGTQWQLKDVPQGSLPYQTGNIAVVRLDSSGNLIYLTQNTGTINYNTGTVVLNNIRVDSILQDPIFGELAISVSPGSTADPANPNQVYVDQNVYTDGKSQVITLKQNGITVTLLPSGS